MSSFAELLDARPQGDGFRLRFGRELHGAFGGAFGGLLAAATVHAARAVEPDRIPAGLDCRFLRSLPAGDAVATAAALHEGRSVTLVRVDLHDELGRLATMATVSLVAGGALHPLDVDRPEPLPPDGWRPATLPPGVGAPIIELLEPELCAVGGGAIAAAVTVPWEVDATTSAEAACVAGDFSVGPPVAAACEGAWLPHPNPDLSLRFTPVGAPSQRLVGVGRVVRIRGGLAVVDVDVHADDEVYASGAATSLVFRQAAS